MIRQLSTAIETAFRAMPPPPSPTLFEQWLDHELLSRLSTETGQNVRHIDEGDWHRAIRLQNRRLVFCCRIGTRYAARLMDAGREFLTTSRFAEGGE